MRWLRESATQKVFYKSEYEEGKALLEPIIFETKASVSDIIKELESRITTIEPPLGHKIGIYQISKDNKAISYACNGKFRPRSFEAEISFIARDSKTECIYNITKWNNVDGLISDIAVMRKFHKQVQATFATIGNPVVTVSQGNNESQNFTKDDNTAQIVRNLENIAFMLDRANKGGGAVDEKIEEAQTFLNSIKKQLKYDKNALGSDTYLVYEVQGLIYSIRGSKKETRTQILEAKKLKGDSNLFTDSANGIMK